MKVYNPLNCGGGGEIGPEEFGSLVDLMLTTATAYQTIPEYPIDFGKPPEVTIQVDKEFSVLTDWRGLVLTQGFEIED